MIHRRVWGMVLLGGLLGGCAGAHLYNPEQAQLATQGKKGVDSLDFTAFMAAEDKNIAAYDEAERKSWRDNILLQRDLMLAGVAQSGEPFETAWIGAESALGKHVGVLLGQHPSTITAIGEAGEQANAADVKLKSDLDGVRVRVTDPALKGLSLPRCAPQNGELIPPRTISITRELTTAAENAGVNLQLLLEVYDGA